MPKYKGVETRNMPYQGPLINNPTSEMAFEQANNFLSTWEGGYADHPTDLGGPTNFGISQKSYPDLNIKKLTRNQAKDIYKRDYWDPLYGDRLPQDVARVAFDTAVNTGLSQSVKLLQRSVGVKPDGKLGPKTIKGIRTYIQENGSHDLALDILEKRRWLYRKIVGRDNSQKVFLKNWMRRVDALRDQLVNESVQRDKFVANSIAKKALGR